MISTYDKLKKQIAQLEFKKMYSEIGEELVRKASKLGEKHRKQRINFYKNVDEILKAIDASCSGNFFKYGDVKGKIYDLAGGVDGSSQITGGDMGIYYVVASAILIIFQGSLDNIPKIRSIADIKDLDEVQERQINLIKTLYMLGLENKAIELWSVFTKKEEGILFIDGPIVDPPYYYDKSYISERTKVLKKAKKNSLVVGCVKRLRGKAFISYLKSNLDQKTSKLLEKYNSDRDLIPTLFVKFRRKKGIKGPLATNYFDLTKLSTSLSSEISETYKGYLQEGIRIISFFYERSAKSKVLRIDILVEPSTKESEINKLYSMALANLEYWSYSTDPYPWIIFLADKLSNIGKGAADLLYEEIVSRESVLEEDVLLSKFKTR